MTVDTNFRLASDVGVITQDIARAVLWAFGDSAGVEPGSFESALLVTVGKADEFNRAKLRRSFPQHVAAWSTAANHPEGIAILRAIANPVSAA